MWCHGLSGEVGGAGGTLFDLGDLVLLALAYCSEENSHRTSFLPATASYMLAWRLDLPCFVTANSAVSIFACEFIS